LGEVSQEKKWFLSDGYSWRANGMLDLLASDHFSLLGVVSSGQHRNSQYTKAGVSAGGGVRIRGGTSAENLSFYVYATGSDTSLNQGRRFVGGMELQRRLNRRIGVFVQFEAGKLWFVQPGAPTLLSGSSFSLRVGLSWSGAHVK